jgi:hypothetical protein
VVDPTVRFAEEIPVQVGRKEKTEKKKEEWRNRGEEVR